MLFAVLQETQCACMQLNRCQERWCLLTDGALKVRDNMHAAEGGAAPKLLRKIFRAASAALWLAAVQQRRCWALKLCVDSGALTWQCWHGIDYPASVLYERWAVGRRSRSGNGQHVRAFTIPRVAYDLHREVAVQRLPLVGPACQRRVHILAALHAGHICHNKATFRAFRGACQQHLPNRHWCLVGNTPMVGKNGQEPGHPTYLRAEPVSIGNTLLGECCTSGALLTLHVCKAALHNLAYVRTCMGICIANLRLLGAVMQGRRSRMLSSTGC
jgi:hypothetical protein